MVNKEELIKGTLEFINIFERLPYLKEDDIEVGKLDDDNEIIIKPFRSLKYVNELFGSKEKFTKHLLDSNILSLETVSKYTGVKVDRLKELLSEKAEDVNIRERRLIHVFFDVDYYYKQGEYAKKCIDCKNKKKCGQEYWVDVLQCKKHKKK